MIFGYPYSNPLLVTYPLEMGGYSLSNSFNQTT